MFTRACAAARTAGAVDTLPILLGPLGAVQAWTGRYATAAATAGEGLRLALDTGQENAAAHHRSVLAWLAAVQGASTIAGTRRQRRSPVPSAIGWARRRGSHPGRWPCATSEWVGPPRLSTAWMRWRLRGRARAIRWSGRSPPPTTSRLRCGWIDATAPRRPRRFCGRGHPTCSRRGLWHCRPGATPCSPTAPRSTSLALPRCTPQSSRPFDAARTDLLRGEFLRRRRSRGQARTHLRAACEAFEGLGATPWAERARIELQATGETARKRDPSTLTELTPQELQIARLVGAGGTNREIAAELFLSPRTIDYHLHKIFTKLGISSRAELVRLDAER